MLKLMSIRRHSGRTKVIHLRKADSVAIDNAELVKFSTADPGFVAPATGDTHERIIGVSRDSYASDTGNELVAIEVPLEQYVEWDIDVDSDGGLADTDVGYLRGIDTLGANLDASSVTLNTFLVVKNPSATRAIGVLTQSMLNYNSFYNGFPST